MSTIRANTILDASGGSNAQLFGVASPPNSMGFRNRIINGDMRIDQRNNGAAVTMTNAILFIVDRWWSFEDTDGTMTAQRSTVAPTGFNNSLLCTTTVADTSLSATQRVVLNQTIEGFNIADFGWGTANAQAVTVSFWVRSSLTGTFGGSVKNSGNTRSYPFTYTISAANTWEQKAVAIPGDTTGTWLTNNETGMQLNFGLGVGSTFSGTAGAWAATDYNSATGAVSVVGTNGATFYITGVQLEAGTVASPFERRDYGRELMMCQRYYTRFLSEASYTTFGIGTAYNTSTVRIALQPPVRMRAKPTSLDASAGSTFLTEYGSAGLIASAVALSGNDSSTMLSVQFTVSGATAGASYAVYANGTTNAYLGFGAEL